MMILRILLTIIFLLMACRGFAGAVEVIVLKSNELKIYEEAIEVFRNSCGCSNIVDIVLSELHDEDVVKELRKSRPKLIVAVGVDALLKVKHIKDIPIVYLMIHNPWTLLSSEENITGVSMDVSPGRQLAKLKEVLPEVKRVGLVYDPAKSGAFVEKAREASRELGIKLVLKEIDRPKNVDSAIRGIAKDGIDVLWMLPDSTVITAQTVASFILSSLDNRIPILTFSEKFLDLGAVMSVSTDHLDMGKQAGEMAKRILSGTKVADLPRVDARRVVLSLNLKTARKIGIAVSSEAIGKAQNIIN
jgi:putative ABC transport system substrate-binding protein